MIQKTHANSNELKAKISGVTRPSCESKPAAVQAMAVTRKQGAANLAVARRLSSATDPMPSGCHTDLAVRGMAAAPRSMAQSHLIVAGFGFIGGDRRHIDRNRRSTTCKGER